MVVNVFFDVESTGLDRFVDSVVCVVVVVDGGVPVRFVGVERDLLERFFVFLGGLRGRVRLVSFNGWGFDVPFLWARALRYGLVVPGCLGFSGFSLDLYYLLCRRGRGKLSDFCGLLGLEVVGSGKDSKRLVESGDVGAVVDHCVSDVLNLRSLFLRCVECGLVDE